MSRKVDKRASSMGRYFEPAGAMARHYHTFVSSQNNANNKVVIVGAGVSGTVLAILLAQRGVKVHVFEKNADPFEGQVRRRTVDAVDPDSDDDAPSSAPSQPPSGRTETSPAPSIPVTSPIALDSVAAVPSAVLLAKPNGPSEPTADTEPLLASRTDTAAVSSTPPSPGPTRRPQAINNRSMIEHTVVLSQRGMGVLGLAGITVPPQLAAHLRQVINHSGWGIRRRDVSELGVFSVCRFELVKFLIAHARANHREHIRFHFGYRFVSMQLQSPSQPRHEALFATTADGQGIDVPLSTSVPFDLLCGCDGPTSRVRDALVHAPGSDVVEQQSPLSWVCYVFEVPHAAARLLSLDLQEQNVWGTNNCRLEVRWGGGDDGVFIGTLYHPEDMFLAMRESSLRTRIELCLKSVFPDVFSALSASSFEMGGGRDPERGSVLAHLRVHEVADLVSASCSRISVGPVVLLGDAANTTSPLLQQGCNSALEDCLVLNQALQRETSLLEATRTYHLWRHPEHRALTQLATWRDTESDVMADLNTVVQIIRRPFAVPADHMLLASFATYSAVAERRRSERKGSFLLAVVIAAVVLGLAGLVAWLVTEH